MDILVRPDKEDRHTANFLVHGREGDSSPSHVGGLA